MHLCSFSLQLKIIEITFYHDFEMTVDNLTIALIKCVSLHCTLMKRDMRLWTSNVVVHTNSTKMDVKTKTGFLWERRKKTLEFWVILHSLWSSFSAFNSILLWVSYIFCTILCNDDLRTTDYWCAQKRIEYMLSMIV